MGKAGRREASNFVYGQFESVHSLMLFFIEFRPAIVVFIRIRLLGTFIVLFRTRIMGV